MESRHFADGPSFDSAQTCSTSFQETDFCTNHAPSTPNDLNPLVCLNSNVKIFSEDDSEYSGFYNFISSLNVQTINELLAKGILWKMFTTRKAPSDGHCFMHALEICLIDLSHRKLYPNPSSIGDLLDNLRSESLNNMEQYLPAITGCSPKVLVLEMISYIYLKIYNSNYGDLVTQIMSNVLSVNLFIIVEYPNGQYYVHLIEPFYKKVNDNIFLHKRGEHYDACLPLNVENIFADVSNYLTEPEYYYPNGFTLERTFSDSYNVPSADTSNACLSNASFSIAQNFQSGCMEQGSFLQAKNTSSENLDLFKPLKFFRRKHSKNLIFGYLNINSLRWKFHEVMNELLTLHLIDIMFFAETKLDSSFPPEQFSVSGFREPPYREDRNKYGGGLVCYIRSDIPNRRRYDVEKMFQDGVESLAIEVSIRQEKWLFLGFYKPPKIKNTCFISSLENVINTFHSEFKSFYLMGDSNIDQNKKPEMFNDFLDIFGISNLIHEPTCFKSDTPTLIDLILTDTPGRVANTININTGLSDFHNLIAACTRIHVPKSSQPVFKYRSMKYFDENAFIDDLSMVPFHVTEIFDDANDAYWLFDKLYLDVLDKHAPIKTARKHPKHAPFMHTELRKARNVKAMLRRKYDKFPNNDNWKTYKKQRNYVTKLRNKSIKQYFIANCDPKKSPGMFWKVIKPFISNKVSSQNVCISLHENDTIVHDNLEVCNIFNNHFLSSANLIGSKDPIKDSEWVDDITAGLEKHTSVACINDQNLSKSFQFRATSCEYVLKLLSRINIKKSTGADSQSPRLVKLSASVIGQPLTSLINMSISTNTFPDALKEAEVSPIFKKDDSMNKNNYRPVSILPCISKIFEKVYCEQMVEFFNAILSASLSAFRKSYSCESVLIEMVEQWKDLLDQHKVVGAMLLDLSKAFDCLPHRLLIAKLEAYGFENDSCQLIASYLKNRRQRVKIGDSRSEWQYLIKGVPQGSILGPLLFNIFLNDIFYSIQGLFNYADDNTISKHGDNAEIVKSLLEETTTCALDWFAANQMQANPTKFQAILLGNKSQKDISFHISGNDIYPQKTVKLLGVEIDDKLSFKTHISTICSKAGRQLSALARLSRHLDVDTKLLILNSFILSNFNYCPLVWHHCSIVSTLKMEKIQERGLRFVYNDPISSYSELLSKSGKNMLYIDRLKKLAIFVYKCIKLEGPSNTHNLFSKKKCFLRLT